jgi:hypothetical protein
VFKYERRTFTRYKKPKVKDFVENCIKILQKSLKEVIVKYILIKVILFFKFRKNQIKVIVNAQSSLKKNRKILENSPKFLSFLKYSLKFKKLLIYLSELLIALNLNLSVYFKV